MARVGQYIDIKLYRNIKISIECNIFNYWKISNIEFNKNIGKSVDMIA